MPPKLENQFSVFENCFKPIIAHGAAGRAAFGNDDFRRGPVNVAVIRLRETDANIHEIYSRACRCLDDSGVRSIVRTGVSNSLI